MNNEFARITAFVSPEDAFDEIIPDHGVKIDQWRIYKRKMKFPVNGKDEKLLIDVTELVAEISHKEDELRNFDKEILPGFNQIRDSLAALYDLSSPGTVRFGETRQFFVKDGTIRNMHPIQIDIGINIEMIEAKIDGNIVFNAEKEKQFHARNNVKKEKHERKTHGNKYVDKINDRCFRRALERYHLAKEENNITFLYDIRDAIHKKFGEDKIAIEKLGLKAEEWKRFGAIFNRNSIEGGRHLGKYPEPTKSMANLDLCFIKSFSKEMLLRFGDYLQQCCC